MDKTLAEIQAEFTGYLRNPSAIAIPDDLPAEPMRIYSSLVFRNVQSLLTSNFPVLAEITQKNGHWDALTQEFIRDHKAQTDLSPVINATSWMRFPDNRRIRRSQNEEALQRRTNHQGHQAA